VNDVAVPRSVTMVASTLTHSSRSCGSQELATARKPLGEAGALSAVQEGRIGEGMAERAVGRPVRQVAAQRILDVAVDDPEAIGMPLRLAFCSAIMA
jgi:hypothetical protein